MKKNLKSWITSNNLEVLEVNEKVILIPEVGRFLIIESKEVEEDEDFIFSDDDFEGPRIIDPEFDLIVSEEEHSLFKEHNCNFYLFSFGNLYYYSDSYQDIKLLPFSYLGKSKRKIQNDFCHLGVHGGYEILNGSRSYEDWIIKTKFIGLKSLGICEKNTLAGSLPFQLKCLEEGIKPIIGETVSVDFDGDIYYVKLFVKNITGWKNLLKVNKEINVVNERQFIFEEDLLKYGDGLICVISTLTKLSSKMIKKFSKAYENLYYQIDTTEYMSDEQDRNILFALKDYFNNYITHINPVLLNDSYYLEKSQSSIKKLMNSFRSTGIHESLSDNQYYKDVSDSFKILSSLFPDKSKFNDKDFYELFDEMVDNTLIISDMCNYQIGTKGFKLPKFQFNGLNKEYKKFSKTDDEIGLFWYLIEKGIKSKAIDDDKIQVYRDRIDFEFKVIEKGGFIGYFLILWDIMEFCEQNNILTGLGRGSAGGSLIAYILNITKFDPIKYDLIFERFMNEGRLTSLPDIDSDFESKRREEVKRYIEQRYGVDNVVSIGTYNTYQLKSAFQDLCRVSSVSASTADELSKIMNDDLSSDIESYFKTALVDRKFYDFVQNHSDVINNTALIMNQASSSSIHPCAIVISPQKDSEGNDINIYEWMPVRLDRKNNVLISEWTGEYLEKVGFLKEDILGLLQLDKFRGIFDLVEKNHGIKLTYDKIGLYNPDPKVMELFQKGISQDVFQFGTQSLISYTKKVVPFNIEELIAINSLYRPGPMDSNAHDDYVELKFGRKKPEYDRHLKHVTESTYGLFIYQEQVMAAASIIGNFNLAEADDVRRAMGKKKASAMEPYKIRFIAGALEKDYTQEEADALWNKLLRFSGYGFNKSHAAAYSLTGYICQWLKCYYPLEFYTVSLHYCKDDSIPNRVNEIKQLGTINVGSPDINSSIDTFVLDSKTNSIYWSLNKIKFIADVSSNHIFQEREKNGLFFSLEEFLERVNKSEVDIRVAKNLILSGAFDKIEKIKIVTDRYRLLKNLFEIRKQKFPEEEYSRELVQKEYFWRLKQKEITGLADVDFKRIIKQSSLREYTPIKETEIYMVEYKKSTTYVISGILTQIVQRKPKNNPENVFAQLTLNINNIEVHVTMWNDTYKKYQSKLNDYKGGIIVMSGNCKMDDFKGKNVFFSNQYSEVIFI